MPINDTNLERHTGTATSSEYSGAHTNDSDGDAVMTDSTESDPSCSAPDLGAVKDASKGVSDNTLAGYQSLIKQCEKWLKDHHLIKPEDMFFRADPHLDSPDMICAWIMDLCDLIRLDGAVRPETELFGLGNETWHQSEVTQKWLVSTAERSKVENRQPVLMLLHL
ncbi:hypothetical protein Moror_9980 [Moniliophthora roreri MCA 2997]|uniref:Uncharacterized protein n=2 Tax=Moniliophthora roreri TaxID=221103 RepID=V2WVJ2_MONRO|nr:hypothetical protein Moror_9980 [Moniliophthora roreri MCA 2997]